MVFLVFLVFCGGFWERGKERVVDTVEQAGEKFDGDVFCAWIYELEQELRVEEVSLFSW